MPTVAITDIAIRAFTLPEKGQVTYWDKGIKGFGLRVSQGGSKTFIAMYGAHRQRTTIGRYPIVTLAKAREQAKRILAEHTLGKLTVTPVTFEDAKERFLKDKARKRAEGTVHEYRRLLECHFNLSHVQLSAVTQQELHRRIYKLDNTPSEQNHAHTAIKVFLNWAVKHGYIEHNPLAHHSLPNTPTSRDRVLTDTELAEVYRKALAYPYPYGSIVSLLILTGQRRGEIATLQRLWLHEHEQTIIFPKEATKNRREHTIPCEERAHAVIEDVPKLGNYLFPARRSHVRGKATTIFNGWQKAKIDFDETLEDVAPYTLHDLRRTFSSTHAALGTPIHITEKLLNHVSGTVSGVAAIYNRHSYIEEMREALSNYEAHLHTLTSD